MSTFVFTVECGGDIWLDAPRLWSGLGVTDFVVSILGLSPLGASGVLAASISLSVAMDLVEALALP